jgi:hypothetical protein
VDDGQYLPQLLKILLLHQWQGTLHWPQPHHGRTALQTLMMTQGSSKTAHWYSWGSLRLHQFTVPGTHTHGLIDISGKLGALISRCITFTIDHGDVVEVTLPQSSCVE